MKKKCDESCGCQDQQYPDHTSEIKRLNRISGQIEGVKKMIDERRYCPDIMTQLRAIRSAVKSIESNMLETHLSACLTSVLATGDSNQMDQKIAEIAEIFKRFED